MTEIIVTVIRPELTPKERERRMKEIRKATVELMKSKYKKGSKK